MRRFWNFKLIFVRMQFSLVATLFFSLVLVICLSWYLHLKLSHDLLTLVSFNVWRYKFSSGVIYLNTLETKWCFKSFLKINPFRLDLSTKLEVIWIVLKCYYLVYLILDLFSFILDFTANFEHLELFFFKFHISDYFYLRINIPNIHNNIIDI